MGRAASLGSTEIASSIDVGAPPAHRGRRRAVRVAGAVGAALTVLTALVGALHMPMARPLLARLGIACPMGRATPESIDHDRHIAAATLRGTDAAPARPAFAFALDRTTRADVRAWSDTNHLRCDEGPAMLRCRDVAPAVLGVKEDVRIDEVTFGFDPAGRLVNLTTFRTHLDAETASRAATAAAAALRLRLGNPAEERGSFGADSLGRGTLASGTVAYRYRDYVADVTALNLGGANVTVREHYMSAVD